MNTTKLMTAVFSAAVIAPIAAKAQPVLDGSGFGSTPSATVTYDAGASTSNFGSPGTTTSGAAYNIFTRSDATYAYVLVSQTGTGTSAGSFANLYFGTGATAFSGSDVGFEVTNSDVFSPGGPARPRQPARASSLLR